MQKRALATLVALSLCLHIAVPAGFMPASVASGWPLQWCPEGMSASSMRALFGHAHHHHHSADQPDFQQCDLSGLYAESMVAATVAIIDSDSAQPTYSLIARFSRTTKPGHYHPRAPPRRSFT